MYFRLFFLYRKSWEKIRSPLITNNLHFVSVIVACRNEDKNILNLIYDLKNQNYDIDRFELIIVNDHSNDNTLSILNSEMLKCPNLKVINLNDSIYGKKNAIREAVKIARGEIVLCTDADCRVGDMWLLSMVSYFSKMNCKFVSGPVVLNRNDSFFAKYQYLELISLISSSASAIIRGKATLCNGANLAFRKSDYLLIPENIFNDFSSDDVSLLHFFKNKYHNSIYFAKEKEAIVTTLLSYDLMDYFRQKMRWIYSARFLRDSDTILVSILVFLMNLSIPFTFFFILNPSEYFFSILFFLISIIKILIDYFYLKSVFKFFTVVDSLLYILPFSIINSVLTVVIVPLSFIVSHKWKGRKI